jgi:predicted transcriptional regulator
MYQMFPLLSEIRRKRKILDLTQQELAKTAGVSRSLIAKVETENANPSYAEAKKIFETLDKLEAGAQQRMAGITLDKVQNTDIVWAEADEPLQLGEQKMIDNKYSQLPVKRNGQMVGSLTERGINQVLMANKDIAPKNLLVGDVMEEGFPRVPVSATVGDVIPLLQAYQGILTIKNGEIAGIVTNAGILEHFQTKSEDKESAPVTTKKSKKSSVPRNVKILTKFF